MAAEGRGDGRQVHGSPASMGPRPVGRGRLTVVVLPYFCFQRQWGRDRLAAEGPSSLTQTTLGAVRQWGRDRLAAEGRQGRGDKDHAGAASMGPRPVGRGRLFGYKCRTVRPSASMGPRPVGRGRRVRSRPSCPPARVNGAATGWPRKAHCPLQVGAAGKASMGPRPVGRGRSCTSP